MIDVCLVQIINAPTAIKRIYVVHLKRTATTQLHAMNHREMTKVYQQIDKNQCPMSNSHSYFVKALEARKGTPILNQHALIDFMLA